ncbi:Nuclear elongation and deformation protein 1 [Leucoagaricus sp. SymC.cos]|nr:Nuclear elongation and deformation protein 1 [Leucoagaricus sp. SymC.cos]
MNYLRGAVNAISAPYQYYKELPPINPSTLTGAIDVIVIQRPGSGGETELACSPFHVRFGKWQVLRPSDKKVNVFVNGQPIPYSMKIGEAGEAFFVFETDEDISPDLITSPILQPTRPEEEVSGAQTDATTGRFGSREYYTSHDANLPEKRPESITEKEFKQENRRVPQEPEFLDLDARNGEAQSSTSSKHGLPSPPNSRSHTPELDEQDRRVDEALKDLNVALDITGYHASHMKEESDQTICSSDSEKIKFPTLNKRPSKSSPSKILLQGTQSAIHSTRNSSPSDTDSESELQEPSSSHSPHRQRATSEPPPELDDHIRPPTEEEFIYEDADYTPSSSKTRGGQKLKLPSLSSPPSGVLEYSWEWGAFPTPSPIKTTFGRGGRMEGGVPWKGKTRQLDELPEAEVPSDNLVLNSRGRLSARDGEGTTFVLTVENRPLEFELSLVSQVQSDVKGKAREQASATSPLCSDCEEIFGWFQEVKISFSRFMQDDEVARHPNLVVKWMDGQYLTRHDHPALFHALAIWRTNTLDLKAERSSSLQETTNEARHARSKSLPPTPEQKVMAEAALDKAEVSEKKPSSWWWSRSRPRDLEADGIIPAGERSALRPVSSAPSPPVTAAVQPPSAPILDDDVLKDLSVEKVVQRELETAPALQTSFGASRPASPPVPTEGEQKPKPPRKFAKTLRLTSDQLKSLGLKPGANTITFSISSGVIACTARIFVWKHTDLVVISDIDGTITKSDGLGHVFAMIGRDWTHVGVAKLYTDIVRNGYKIMYLTSRAIGQADATRGYLKGIKQNDYQLPEGPVIMSPDRLMASLHREVIMRKPEVFKMACLRDIQRLFGEDAKNPFYAGFGNRITDALSYRSVNVPSARIFTIDSTGEVKMELLELAGYKSSYIHMTDLVDQMFPPIHKKWTPEYTDFNYWKTPVLEYPLPDLTPPSPTLSARSDTSNQSTLAKLRNFRLMGSRANSIVGPPNGVINEHPDDGGERSDFNCDPDLRQMSSFERLVSGLRRSVSPSNASRSSYAVDSDSESDVDGHLGVGHRQRRTSMTSMPGSLDDMQFGIEDDEDDGHWEDGEHGDEDGYEDDEGEGYGDGPYEGEVDEDMAIDEDLLAATEMKKIPFL